MGKRIDWSEEQLNTLPKSVGEAIIIGSKYYFNGRLCQKMHYCPRSATSGKCVYCVRERQTLRTRNLRRDKTRIKGESKKSHGLSRSLEIKLFNAAKQRALKKRLDFSILVTDIIIPRKCPILKIKLSKLWGNVSQDSKSRFDKPSLDRIDSSKGYVLGNIEVLSYRANMIKGDGTIQEHLKIAAFLKKYGL